MASFRRGAEAVKAAATRSGGNSAFRPTHRWEEDEKKYLQFVHDYNLVTTVLMHRFIRVGTNDQTDKPIYRDFISRRDPNLDGSEGYDPLITRFGVQPKERTFAIAVELRPIWGTNGKKKVIEDWEVVTREFTDSEGTKKTVPNVALVEESPYTFFGHLAVIDEDSPIEDNIFSVTRTGSGTDTTYTINPVDDAMAIEDLEGVSEFLDEFDFDGYLDTLASEDRIREAIEDLPDDYPVSRYGKKKTKKASDESETTSRSTRRRRAPREEEPVDEADDSSDDAGDDEPRKRRFSELRQASQKK